VQLAFFSASSDAEPTSQPASRPRSFAPTTSRSAVPQKLSSARPAGLWMACTCSSHLAPFGSTSSTMPWMRACACCW
jgi:hypothetical protein